MHEKNLKHVFSSKERKFNSEKTFKEQERNGTQTYLLGDETNENFNIIINFQNFQFIIYLFIQF